MAREANASGQISRETLNLVTPYREPAMGLEREIALAFTQAFEVDKVGADDDFYDLGGDSLLGETLSMEILQRTGQTFNMSWFFETGTPAKVAARLGAVPEAAPGGKPPIFVVHGRPGYTVPRPAFYSGLAEGQKLELFELPGYRGVGQVYDTIEDISAAYVRQLQATWPTGPVLISSFCTGGLIAVEMAHQLEAAGRPVQHLVLIDPGLPVTLSERHSVEMSEQGMGPPPSHQGFELRRLGMKLGTLLTLGRATDGHTKRDFEDENLRKWTARYFYFHFVLERIWLKLARRRVKNPGIHLKIGPKAKLRAAYRHYWPASYSGTVDIVASEFRRPTFEKGQLWAHMLPKLKFFVTGETHGDVLKAEAKITAQEMQRLFDESLARPKPVAAAPARQVEPAE